MNATSTPHPPATPAKATIFERPADTCRRTGLGLSTLYAHIDRGIWPEPVRLSRRFVVFPKDEVDAVLNARIAGKTDAEIRVLVATIMQARKQRI